MQNSQTFITHPYTHKLCTYIIPQRYTHQADGILNFENTDLLDHEIPMINPYFINVNYEELIDTSAYLMDSYGNIYIKFLAELVISTLKFEDVLIDRYDDMYYLNTIISILNREEDKAKAQNKKKLEKFINIITKDFYILQDYINIKNGEILPPILHDDPKVIASHIIYHILIFLNAQYRRPEDNIFYKYKIPHKVHFKIGDYEEFRQEIVAIRQQINETTSNMSNIFGGPIGEPIGAEENNEEIDFNFIGTHTINCPKDFECPICLRNTKNENNPIQEANGCVLLHITPEEIDHTICLDCAEKLVKHAEDNKIKCPTCRTEININPGMTAGKKSRSTKSSTAKKSVSKKPVSKKHVSKKHVSKKAVSKKHVSKKLTTKKPVSKKPVSKKLTTKKPVSKKAISKKAISKKPVSKKPVSKKPVSKKPVSKKAISKKPVSKKPVSKKAISKKAVSKKAVSKKSTTKLIVINK